VLLQCPLTWASTTRPSIAICRWSWKSQADPDAVKTVVKETWQPKPYCTWTRRFYADAVAELLEFAEIAQLPVITTLKAKSAFPKNTRYR
jgi:thiamine pyrophosphate-dependent acetolactate synthase large subunit-like protein